MREMAKREMLKALAALLSRVETLDEFVSELDGAALADIGAKVKSACDKLSKTDKAIKARIIDRGEQVLMGEIFKATLIESVRWTLDTKAVKLEMGEEWAIARSKQSTSRSVRYGAA